MNFLWDFIEYFLIQHKHLNSCVDNTLQVNNNMQCPNCSNPMQESKRYEVYIDYCPTCKGVWLDRGEISKMTNTIKISWMENSPVYLCISPNMLLNI